MANSVPFPGPPGLPLIGNMADVDPVDIMRSLSRLADTYGEIYKLSLGGGERLVISSHALLNEICDEKRFTKIVAGPLKEMRNAVEDGLFTANYGEHNWEVAHRVLVPAFGPLSIRSMFDEMHDMASQLVVKWARFGPAEKINVTDDFTRLTLDSIALCAMDTRFNSFYKEQLHPFVYAMSSMLAESGARANRPAFANYFMRGAQQKYEADIALLKKVAGEVVAERRAHPSDKKDLLNAMINGRDPKTGEGLTDQSIINNMITFLIAGHETTSGLLSFLFYYLLKNPAAYQAAQKEVDEVVGRGPITIDHMSKIPYLEACLRETLRLQPTASSFSIHPLPNTSEYPVMIGGGKYQVQKGQVLVALLPKVHRDPAVWGDDAEEFKPDRMLDEAFAKLPPNSWKPFGNGMRGCIGRPFAWQEALVSTAMLLQNFHFSFDDPSYQLQIKQTLTLKPKGFFMHATLRDNIDSVHLEKLLHVDMSAESKLSEKDKRIATTQVSNGVPKTPMIILYGSNSGTCEGLAQSLARVAGARAFNVGVSTLDSFVDKIPQGAPVILISSSYEGQSPDNAVHFMTWLSSLDESKQLLEGVNYAVYGVGNHDWVQTFHKVPKAIDSLFSLHGGTRLAPLGRGDVAAGDIFNDFDKWQDDLLWPSLDPLSPSSPLDASSLESTVVVEIDTQARRSTLRQDVQEAIVLSNQILTSDSPWEGSGKGKGDRNTHDVVPEKRHLSLRLPSGMSYKVGDYLAVLPLNHVNNIRRVLRRFGVPWDAMLRFEKGGNTTLPVEQTLTATDVLGAYVELSQPATKRNILRISASIPDPAERKEVAGLAGPDFESTVALKRLSPLDILEAHPTAALPLGDFLAMLPPMRIRQYSISSSPLVDPGVATITWTVLDTPSKATGNQRFLGVASNYLSHVEESERVHVAVKPCHGHFHPPNDIENTPVIMICAGSGVAPFRGFVQERAMQAAAGRRLAPAFLFVGCAHPDRDQLFKDELANWDRDGVVKVYYAYSKAKERSKGCRYVQERLWEERGDMVQVFRRGAKLYACGSALVSEGVAATTKKIYMDAMEAEGKDPSEEDVEAWFQNIRSDRYASDVFV